MTTNPAEFDHHGNPVLYDVRDRHPREGIVGAPLGTELTNDRTGRRFRVTTEFPLDPDYIAERDRLTELKRRAAHARASKKGNPDG